jgi:hypothetical protein
MLLYPRGSPWTWCGGNPESSLLASIMRDVIVEGVGEAGQSWLASKSSDHLLLVRRLAVRRSQRTVAISGALRMDGRPALSEPWRDMKCLPERPIC